MENGRSDQRLSNNDVSRDGSHVMRVAAIQFEPTLGDVDANLRKANDFVHQALSAGAQWVVLPELFTTGMAFDESMLGGHRPLNGEPAQLLAQLASEGNAVIGGSFLAEADGQVYNTFVLATPEGDVQTHDKDFPSGPIEHAYYAGGEDAEFVSLLLEAGVGVQTRQPLPSRDGNNTDGVFVLPGATAGVALCWEMIRRRTVKRLAGRIDVLLASSAWPEIDPDVGFPGMSREQIIQLNGVLRAMLKEAPNRLARMLGVPVIHANLVGPQRATTLFDQSVDVVTRFCGESKVVSAGGETLASRSTADGEGIVFADLVLDKATPQPDASADFWLTSLPPILRELWYTQGAVGREYYLDTTLPYRQQDHRFQA